MQQYSKTRVFIGFLTFRRQNFPLANFTNFDMAIANLMVGNILTKVFSRKRILVINFTLSVSSNNLEAPHSLNEQSSQRVNPLLRAAKLSLKH